MTNSDITLRAISELDIDAVSGIDEKVTGNYKPEDWERRFTYYLRRDPELSLVAEAEGRVIGFMLGEVRAGEFGLDEPSGWIEVMGVDPDFQGRSVGKRLLEGLLENFRARDVAVVRTLVNDETQRGLIGFFEASGFGATPIRTLEQRI